MTTIDVGRLLGDIIDDAARIGGGVIEIANAILDDPRIAVVALPEPTMQQGLPVWRNGDNEYSVRIARDGLIWVGGGYYDPTQGDDPTLLAASLLAAHRHAAKAVRP